MVMMPEHEKLYEFIQEVNPLNAKDIIVSKSVYEKLIHEAVEELNMPKIHKAESYNFHGFRILNGGQENPIYQL